MAHMIDSLAWHGQVPWHGLGLRLPRLATVDEMIRFGGLDWEVIPRPLFQADEAGSGASVPGYKALTRSDRPGTTLAVVSESYGIVQNAEALALAAAAVGSDKAVAEVAGSLDGGRRVFVVLNLKSAGFDVAGERVSPFVVCYTGHDGSTAVGFRFTPVRVVCQNTLSAALGCATPNEMTFRHTQNVAERVARAAKMIESARAYFGLFHTVALHLVNRHMPIETAQEFAERLFPTYRNAAHEVIVPANQRKVIALFSHQVSQGDGAVAGTRWGFFNAVTALLDHNARAGDRMGRALAGNEVRDRAMTMLLAAA